MWVYVVGCFVFTFIVAIACLYQYKYGTDKHRLIKDRVDVVIFTLLGGCMSTFWPILVIVMLIIFLANKVLIRLRPTATNGE